MTGTVRTTDADAVGAEVLRIHRALYPGAPMDPLQRGFEHAALLYQGLHPAYHACDTEFHDLQHVLDATLAMARLMDGYARGRRHGVQLPPALFSVGVLCALFHDIGYLRRRSDRRNRHGSRYTLSRASRSATFLRGYLRAAGFARHADAAAVLVHYTGHERRAESIRVDDSLLRRVGQMLGSADLLAQMADRCYLEKRRDRLYPELVAGGLAGRLVRSGVDLARRTHAFYQVAAQRLDLQLARAYDFAARHFGGQNFYVQAMQQNARYALVVARAGERAHLRRVPPTLARQ